MTQAVVLSAGFSSFHLADIDSGRNVFIVGFSIFMALLLPRWLREAPILLNTGRWSGEGKEFLSNGVEALGSLDSWSHNGILHVLHSVI